MAALVVTAGACGLREWGTSATAVVVSNTCGDPLIIRLTGEKWDRSAEDQRKGELHVAGGVVKEVAVNPPDKEEGLVLRISPPAGEPLFVVAVERDRDLELSIGAEACVFALGAGDGTCDPVIEGDEELAIVCR